MLSQIHLLWLGGKSLPVTFIPFAQKIYLRVFTSGLFHKWQSDGIIGWEHLVPNKEDRQVAPVALP